MLRWSAAVPLALMCLLLAPTAAACISPYGFEDFEPAPLVSPGSPEEMAPVDVSASSVDDLFPRLVWYEEVLYAFWMKSIGTTFVSENLMVRAMSDGEWGPLMVVNNPDPAAGTVEGLHVRIAGFDVAVHDGLLYVAWCTSDPNMTDGTDDDPVLRSYDGERWGPILELVGPSDGGEDVQPTLASTSDGLLVAWTTTSPLISDGTDQDIVARYVGPGVSEEIFELTPEGDSDPDFLARAVGTPIGPHVVWHTRTLREVPGTRGAQYVLSINGRRMVTDRLSDVVSVSGLSDGEDVWVELLWDVDRLCMAWQRRPPSHETDRSTILYREWLLGGLGTSQDITGGVRRATNGRPDLVNVDGEVRVLWHTNDDAIKAGSSLAIVTTTRQGNGQWSPVEVFRAETGHDLMDVKTATGPGGTYATWVMNVTYELDDPPRTARAWDVIVAPIKLSGDALNRPVVTPRWVRSTEAWGSADRLVFRVTRSDEAMAGARLDVRVLDPDGDVETVLTGITGADGEVSFDHVLRSFGDYQLDVTLEGRDIGALGFRVSAPPPGHWDDLLLAALAVVAFVALLMVAGHMFITRRGVVDPREEALAERRARTRYQGAFWGAASRALTRVVRSQRAQGFLQIPLFLLFVVSIVLGFLGTQDPKANFTTMLGWVYYLPGMLILYAFFGRLWCYVEACGFVDTWAKRVMKNRSWREWPEWLQNLWPAFFLLLAGFWVEIVFSIDLYPWAVATFMSAIMLINLAISTNYGKRTYCRFLCRDGVVEELIARFSILRIGVSAREEATERGGACIWKEGEKRPGYCSMCFTCLQNNPDVKEATVTPMVRTYGQDVYRPKAIHRDEAWAALLLMGISIPYMAVLSRAWWVGLADVAAGLETSVGTIALLAAGAGLCVATVAADVLAVRRWPATLTPVRRALLVLLEVLLLANYFIAVVGGEAGRIVALRTLVVLGAIMMPFAVVWIGERLVVRLTRDERRETPGKLLERYGLIFIPVFIGVLIARNLPITGTWGWAVLDIIKATATEFPGGAANVVPKPFVDPALHFALGVAALAFGLALGAYTALQISRRSYKVPRNATRAFAVHCGLLGFMVVLLTALMALPPF